MISVGNQAELSALDFNLSSSSYTLPDVNITYRTKHANVLLPAKISKSVTTTSSIFLQIDDIKATYHINVSNNDQYDNLLVNSKDVELIIPGTETMQNLIEGDTHKYELYSPGVMSCTMKKTGSMMKDMSMMSDGDRFERRRNGEKEMPRGC